MAKAKQSICVRIDYTNWRGERSVRRILPLHLRYGCNEWHKSEQWLLIAVDIDKDAEREFAMLGIHSWTPASQ